ncbi:energy transducer TonB [Lichenicola sp.]|uniref:energy transducer TonB n=1 Tax=Lichenicola sp. TaxID=2804529 RepID=UPI003B00A35D
MLKTAHVPSIIFVCLLAACAGPAPVPEQKPDPLSDAIVVRLGIPITVPPRPTIRGRPAYPLVLARLGIEGHVSVDCAITEEGVPENCVVQQSTDGRFEQSALQAARDTRYLPATRNGVAVRRDHYVTVLNYLITRAS